MVKILTEYSLSTVVADGNVLGVLFDATLTSWRYIDHRTSPNQPVGGERKPAFSASACPEHRI